MEIQVLYSFWDSGSILVQLPLVLLFPLRAVYLVQRVMHFASSRHPTDDFLLHFVHFDAKVRLEGGAATGALHFLHFGRPGVTLAKH